MIRKVLLKGTLTIIIAVGMIFVPPLLCFAQEAAKLDNISLQRTEDDLLILLEHSKSPLNFKIEEIEKPRSLMLYIDGAKVTFRPYGNVPIEIPVNERGVKKIIVEQITDFKQSPPQSVELSILISQPFDYEVNSQWGGQFLVIKISPKERAVRKIAWSDRELEIGPSEKLKAIRAIKEKEAKKARERLDSFKKRKRKELAKKESKAKLEQLRKESEERIKSGKMREEAYKKLRGKAAESKISAVRQELIEKDLYKDITMPSEAKLVIHRVVSSTKVKTVEDCLNITMANYIPIQIAREQQQLAKLRLREARRAFYPSFLGEWRETDGKTVTEDYRGRSYGFQVEQPLFTGGKLMATLRKEQLGELIAKGNFDRVKQDLIWGVSKAYYELIAGKKVLDLLKSLKVREEKLLLQVEQEFKIGSATPAVLLTAQSFFNQICYQVVSAEREFALAKLNLEKAMFTENLDIDGVNYNLKRKKIDVNLEECLELAFRNRPEPKILERTIKSAKYGEDIIRSESLPNVAVITTYGRSGEAFSQRNLNLAKEWTIMGKVKWFLGGNTLETTYNSERVSPFKVTSTDSSLTSQTLGVKFSFWDNLAHFTKRKEAQVTRKQAEKDLAETRNKIRNETEDAYYSYRRYSTQFALALNELGFRRKQLEILKTKKRMNEATVPEIMEAEMQLVQARGNREQSMAAINVAIISLNRAIGVINYFN